MLPALIEDGHSQNTPNHQKTKELFDYFALSNMLLSMLASSTVKDKYRDCILMIPLLYLGFRNTVSACYIAIEVLLFFLVFLHVLIQPYKVHWHNLLESAFFINLLFVNTITIFNYAGSIWGGSEYNTEMQIAVWTQILCVSFPLIYLAVYTVVSAYHNIKMFTKGYQKVSTSSDSAHMDSMEFPARLMDM